MLKRIIIVVMVGVVGLFGLFMVVLFTTPCCALQPVVTLESTTQNADGTIQILLSTTIDDLDELQIIDTQGNVIETQSTAFEKQVNTYFWQTTISGHAQQIRVSTASPLPVGVVVESNMLDWQALDVTHAIGFVRTLTVRLEPLDWSNPRAATMQLTSTEDAFAHLYLYDATGRRIDTMETAFQWDDEANQFIWKITIADDVTQMELHPRNPIETRIDIQSVTSGWLQVNTGIGFVRGELPLLLLDSAIVLDDGRITLRFVASEPVFDQMYVTKIDDAIIATFSPAFVEVNDAHGFVWQVTIPNDAEYAIFVPMKSESRPVLVDSNVSMWRKITVGSDIGFIRQP